MAGYYQYGTIRSPARYQAPAAPRQNPMLPIITPMRDQNGTYQNVTQYGNVVGRPRDTGDPWSYTPKQTPQQLAAAQRDAALRGPTNMTPPGITPRRAPTSPERLNEMRDKYMSINPYAYTGTPLYDSQMSARNQAYVNYMDALAAGSIGEENKLRSMDAYTMSRYNQQMSQQAYGQMHSGQPVTAQMMNAIHSDPATAQQFLWFDLPKLSYQGLPPGTGGSWQAAAAGDENAWMSNPAYAPPPWMR